MSQASAPAGIFETAAQTVDWNFRAAAHRLKLDADVQTILATPWREVHMRIPVRMDDGSLRVFDTWRVQHNTVRGPSIGDLRFDPAVTFDLQRALAQTATWQCALVNIPFGGASSGIACDPAEMSSRELESLTRAFTVRSRRLMGVYEDIIAPGPETPVEAMAWILDEYNRPPLPMPAPVNGNHKKAGFGTGCNGHIGCGAAVVVRQVADAISLDLTDARVMVHGYGPAGKSAMRELAKFGCVMVGVSSQGCALYAKDGLDVDAVRQDPNSERKFSQIYGAEHIQAEAMLGRDCDILVAAGGESSLNGFNAARVRARMIVEATNLCTTPTADIVFEQHGITVVPDLLASAGVPIVAYFDWEQNLEQKSWAPERVRAQMETVILRACKTAIERARQHELSLRGAVNCIALERVARMEKLRAS